MKITTGGKPRKQMTKDEQIDDLKKLCRFFELENRELREQVKNLTIPVVRLQYPLSSAHEMWQMARGMEHDEFVKYYNELIKGIQS